MMKTKETIEQQAEAALQSLDGAGRAEPRPFLLTRIHARLNSDKETGWDRLLSFAARPAFVVTLLFVVLLVNGVAVALRSFNNDNNPVTEQYAVNDDFSTSVTKVYDIENTEP